MTNQIQISIDRDVYEQLQLLMVPPVNDANAAIKELLCQGGRCEGGQFRQIAGQHFSMEQELERSRQGIYDSGGNT